MIVDQDLIDAAERLLRDHFPQGPGRACAAYAREGRILTGVADGDPSSEPEQAPIAQAFESGELISALVSVAWDGPGSKVSVRPPGPKALAQLQNQARRHAQVAVERSDSRGVLVRPLWELVAEVTPENRANSALERGKFGGGMKAIGAELVRFARDPGVVRARAEFQDRMLDALRSDAIRKNAARQSLPGPKFRSPSHLTSISLRHIWLAFELCSEKFTFDVVDSLRSRLEELGCNAADLVHIKQGLEALRNTFGVLIVHAGTRAEVANESPFNPYDSFLIQKGVPIHRYMPFAEPEGPTAAARNEALVRQLILALSERAEGGFAAYLRQRELFKVDLFAGGGTGHCPFSSMSLEMLWETAKALERALAEGIVMLEPDSPEQPI